MKIPRKIATAAVALLLTGWSASAGAVVIYDFTGTATTTGFDGQAVLTLTDAYTPGTALTDAHFMSFQYTNAGNVIDIPGDGTFLSMGGTLPAVSGNPLVNFFLDFAGTGTFIQTFTDGTWVMEFDPASGLYDAGDAGSSTWTLRTARIPEPGALALFGIGLAALGFARRRKEA